MVLVLVVLNGPQNTSMLSESNDQSPTAPTPWRLPIIALSRLQPTFSLCSHPRASQSLGLTEMARSTHHGLPLSFANRAFAESEPPSDNTARLNGSLHKELVSRDFGGDENALTGVIYRDDLSRGV